MKPSIFVATPMHAGNCTDGFSLSCISLQKQALLKNIEVDFVFLSGNAMITSARNTLVRLFLQSNFTHLLFIDSDISFDASQVLDMVLSDKDVIGAVYPTKEISWDRVHSAVKGGISSSQLPLFASNYVLNTVSDESIVLGSENIMEVKHLGTGMLCIKREVFNSLKEFTYSYKTKEGFNEYEFFATNLREGITTEDFYFCESWRKIGGKIFLAPWVILRHTGTYTF
jgi:hypothetical protein